MSGRKEPFKPVRIRESIYKPLLEMLKQEGFVGGFSPYVETICQRIVDRKLVSREKVESEIREEIYAELANDGIIIPRHPGQEYERHRKAG